MKQGAVRVLVALAALGAAAGAWQYFRTPGGEWRPALLQREIATRVLAEHLAERFPQSKILVTGNPFALRRGQSAEIGAFEEAGMRGIETGFGKPDAVKAVYPELRPDVLENPEAAHIDPDTTTPLSFLVTQDAFDRIAREHPQFDVIVSLIGLPVNITQSALWRAEGKPRFALLLPDWRMVGNREAIRHALKSGKIVAAVVSRPGAPGDETPLNGSYQAEFARRFLLVTGENIDELMQSSPHLF